MTNKTAAAARARLVAGEEIPHVDSRLDARGRRQLSARPRTVAAANGAGAAETALAAEVISPRPGGDGSVATSPWSTGEAGLHQWLWFLPEGRPPAVLLGGDVDPPRTWSLLAPDFLTSPGDRPTPSPHASFGVMTWPVPKAEIDDEVDARGRRVAAFGARLADALFAVAAAKRDLADLGRDGSWRHYRDDEGVDHRYGRGDLGRFLADLQEARGRGRLADEPILPRAAILARGRARRRRADRPEGGRPGLRDDPAPGASRRAAGARRDRPPGG